MSARPLALAFSFLQVRVDVALPHVRLGQT